MWTAWNDCIATPQIWDLLHDHDASITSAVWYARLSKGCGADYVCTEAPIHNPDGTESLWCYTKPEAMYGEMRDQLGHFPLQHFWGPMANITSTAWIVDSAIYAAKKYSPNFFYIYLPHLDYAAQKTGPDSEPAREAVDELDMLLGKLVSGVCESYSPHEPLWLVASEYTLVAVDHVLYPNRLLRDAGLLRVRQEEDGEHLDLSASDAWALVDHQFSHIFVRDGNARVTRRVCELMANREGVAEVVAGDGRAKYDLAHQRSGEAVVVSTPDSWQAYYWWMDDNRAPQFARTVDIHRKPGYDPVELFFDVSTKGIPLDATLVRGSHGAPADHPSQMGVLLTSRAGIIVEDTASRNPVSDTDIAEWVLRQFRK